MISRKTVRAYVKTRLERDWLLGIPPAEKYVRAIEKGGEPVHLPRDCPECKDMVVLEESVEMLYEKAAANEDDMCPNCGSKVGSVRWQPWYNP